MKAPKYQNRSGLMPEHNGIAPIVREGLRATIPVREALARRGNHIEVGGDGYTITVRLNGTLPPGIIATYTPSPSGHGQQVALRLAEEPEWPMGEYPDGWLQLDWTPCPKCGAPLVWYEAGYVAGYRVCAKAPHHHVL